jgi:hypothetical protein
VAGDSSCGGGAERAWSGGAGRVADTRGLLRGAKRGGAVGWEERGATRGLLGAWLRGRGGLLPVRECRTRSGRSSRRGA